MPQINIQLTLYVLHAVQIPLALNGGYHSYIAITNLRKYEDLSEKAAKYSKVAATQLRKTRTTEAAGALALVFSICSAIFLLLDPQPSWYHLALNLANLGAGMAARMHMANFWRQKTPVPLVQGFNEGLDRTEDVQRRLSLLEVAWLASALVTALGTRPGAV